MEQQKTLVNVRFDLNGTLDTFSILQFIASTTNFVNEKLMGGLDKAYVTVLRDLYIVFHSVHIPLLINHPPPRKIFCHGHIKFPSILMQ
jgi:hypothetical protein